MKIADGDSTDASSLVAATLYLLSMFCANGCVVEHFVGLSSEDRTLRFLYAQPDFGWITRYVVDLDLARQTMLALTTSDGEIVALLQICRYRFARRIQAEPAFTVSPAYRGRGLAHRMMRLAVTHGRICGLDALTATVDCGNRAMLAVLSAAGMALSRVDDTFEGTLEIDTADALLAA